jgi:hypothetical protein
MHPTMGYTSPRNAWLIGARTWTIDSRRDVSLRTSDAWCSYKSKGAQPKKDKAFLERDLESKFEASTEAMNKGKLPRQKTSSQGLDALEVLGKSRKRRLVEACVGDRTEI